MTYSAQYLDRNAVEEWRKAYINYKGLKKLIKRVEEHHRQRLLILASLESPGSDRLSLPSPRANASKKPQETIVELRERVKVAQTGLAGGYGATGRSEDLAASPPPPHELRPVLLDGTGLKISQAVKDRLSAGKKAGNTRTRQGVTAADTSLEGGDVESGQAQRGDSSGTDGQMPERDIVEQEIEQSSTPPTKSDTAGGRNAPLGKPKSSKSGSASGNKPKKAKKQPPKSLDEYLSHFFDPAPTQL